MNNFFSNKMKAKKYFSILKNYKKNFSKDFVLKNYGLFIGDKAFYKLLKCFEILNEIKNVKGDIIEFGVWNGNNLIALKKMMEYIKIKKKLIGYDSFEGMPFKDKDNGNLFKGDKQLINYIKKFFHLKNIHLIEDDIMNLKYHSKQISKLSLIYIDCDIYDVTKNILEILKDKISKNGLLVFDEGNFDVRRGEGRAAKEFFDKNKKRFKRIKLKKFYQPDLIFKKIK